MEFFLFLLQCTDEFDDVTVETHTYSFAAQVEVERTAQAVSIENVDRVAEFFEHVGDDDGGVERIVEAKVGHAAHCLMVIGVEAVFQALYRPPMFFEETGAFYGLQGVDRHVSHCDGAVINVYEILNADEGCEFEFGFGRFDFSGATGEDE